MCATKSHLIDVGPQDVVNSWHHQIHNPRKYADTNCFAPDVWIHFLYDCLTVKIMWPLRHLWRHRKCLSLSDNWHNLQLRCSHHQCIV